MAGVNRTGAVQQIESATGTRVAFDCRQQLSAAWATAVSFLGLFCLSGATIAAAIKKALNQAEQHLWQAELAAAVAAAIDKVPTPVQESAVGSLAGNPNYRNCRRFRATALTRWQESGVL